MISHGDDRNKINTILPLEWTVATRQKKWTLRKNVGHRGDINRCWYLVTSGRRTPGRRREKPNDWLGPLNGSGIFSPTAKKTRRKVSYWKGLVADRPIAITPGEEDKNISWTRGTQVLQASVKNSIKSISPWKKKDSPVEPRRKIR